MSAPLRLGLNVDHVATVRNARGGALPDPVEAARVAAEAGVDGITAHLREDRRHIRDEDIARLKAEINRPLNLEMAVTAEMRAIALATQPHAVCLVPEKREERTTEGGLDLASRPEVLAEIIRDLTSAGIRVSLFIEPSIATVDAAARLRAPVIELHTGTWCNAVDSGDAAAVETEFLRLESAARRAVEHGLECHAGHGLDYATARSVAALPTITELNIGHFIIGEAIKVGLPRAIAAMRDAMVLGRDDGAAR